MVDEVWACEAIAKAWLWAADVIFSVIEAFFIAEVSIEDVDDSICEAEMLADFDATWVEEEEDDSILDWL